MTGNTTSFRNTAERTTPYQLRKRKNILTLLSAAGRLRSAIENAPPPHDSGEGASQSLALLAVREVLLFPEAPYRPETRGLTPLGFMARRYYPAIVSVLDRGINKEGGIRSGAAGEANAASPAAPVCCRQFFRRGFSAAGTALFLPIARGPTMSCPISWKTARPPCGERANSTNFSAPSGFGASFGIERP